MTLPVIILGAGGHARVLIDCMLSAGYRIICACDPTPKNEQEILGVKVIGPDEEVLKYKPEEVLLVNGIGSVQPGGARKKLFQTFKKQGYTFATIVHPSAIIGREVLLGEGCQVMAGAVIQPGCFLGVNCIVNTSVSLDHDCIIGDHVHIAPGAVLSGGIRIGNDVHVGTAASIIHGVTVGRNTVIGAGAVLIRDAEEGSTLVGVPARRLK